jgi:putative tryptophan/tyrosine transport system substrate-binding protein
VKRRELIRLLAGATVWPLAARAQQTAMPVIGFLSSRSPGESSAVVAAFRRGLGEAGFVEGRNAHIAFRWAEGRNDRLPALATDLVTHQASVIVATGGGPSAMAAKTATTTVPIVFTFGSDPVKAGLVASFNRPGGNLTGVSWFSSDLGPKRLELLLELAPKTAVIALLVNPNNAELASQPADFQEAARTLGKQVHIFNASSEKEIDTAFMTFVGQKADALVVGGDPFFTSRREQLIALAARHAVPASYSSREYVADGGLMSYGNSVVDAYRRAGVYAGRILNGAKPADLPVERLTTFELVINLKTAKGLGLTVPDKLLVAADEVIE